MGWSGSSLCSHPDLPNDDDIGNNRIPCLKNLVGQVAPQALTDIWWYSRKMGKSGSSLCSHPDLPNDDGIGNNRIPCLKGLVGQVAPQALTDNKRYPERKLCQGTRFARTLTYTMMRIRETIGDQHSTLWRNRPAGINHRNVSFSIVVVCSL